MIADMHTHSTCSKDAHSPMTELAEAAVIKGIDCLCVTDHSDIEDFRTGLYDPGCFDKSSRQAAFDETVERYGDKLTLLLGIELGAANHLPQVAEEILGSMDFDFVIGSVHNLSGMQDLFLLEYDSAEYCRVILRRYLDECIELVRWGKFDVIGHIGYPLRFIKEADISILYSDFYERLDGLFSLMVQKGVGLELNTGPLRGTLNSVLPPPELLKMYRERGGELVTTGSDAHHSEDIGSGILYAQSLLRDYGFKYQAVFKKRKPEFVVL